MTTNQDTIAAFLTGKGLTRPQVAGILGNLKVESGFSPTAYNAGERAIGIAQWEGPRRTALQAYARSTGGSESALGTQLAFMWTELNGSESSAFKRFRKTTTATEAAAVWDQYYERSSGEARTQRQRYAAEFASTLGDNVRAGFLPDLGGIGGAIGDAAGAVGGALKGGAEHIAGVPGDLAETVAGKVSEGLGNAAGAIASATGDALVGAFTAPPVRDAGTRILAVTTALGLLWVGIYRISAPARAKGLAAVKTGATLAATMGAGGAAAGAAGAAAAQPAAQPKPKPAPAADDVPPF